MVRKTSYILSAFVVILLASCSPGSRENFAETNEQIRDAKKEDSIAPKAVIPTRTPLVPEPTSLLPPANLPWQGFGVPGPFITPVVGPRLIDDDDNGESCQGCELGVASFSTTNPSDWFEIETLPYPQTTLLSSGRNNGSVKGKVTFTSTGLRVGEPGTYWANFSAILVNNNPEYAPFVPLFLVSNNTFIPGNSTSQIGGVGSLPANFITTVQGSGFLQDLEEGTSLSILATNGGSPQPEPVTVISWSINIYKICD